MLNIFVHKDAHKFLSNLDEQTRERIKKKIKILENNPYPPGCIKLIGTENIFRIRIGDYRVLYYIDYEKSIIIIDKIDRRDRIYQ